LAAIVETDIASWPNATEEMSRSVRYRLQRQARTLGFRAIVVKCIAAHRISVDLSSTCRSAIADVAETRLEPRWEKDAQQSAWHRADSGSSCCRDDREPHKYLWKYGVLARHPNARIIDLATHGATPSKSSPALIDRDKSAILAQYGSALLHQFGRPV
jgi:hypothetical protein